MGCDQLREDLEICNIENMRYAQEIMNLLNSIVKVMSTAIDARTPYNANHTKNMVRYAEQFIAYLDATNNEWRFDKDQAREFLMCVWLHDVGKLVIPLGVMNKDNRLGYIRLTEVKHRLEKIDLLNRLSFAREDITAAEFLERDEFLRNAKSTIFMANEAGNLTEHVVERLEQIKTMTYLDIDGCEYSWLTDDEMECLKIPGGTLSPEEREVIKSHVNMTEKLLDEVAFPDKFKNVARWASMHHELLNGNGYPRGLKGEDIDREVRLLTILDVFEALTAMDRPYKAPMPIKDAIGVLDKMANAGEIDKEILELFKSSKAWV